MKDMERKEIEWLHSAVEWSNGKNLLCIFDESAIATDGCRLHTINPDRLPNELGDMTRDEILEKSVNLDSVRSEFSVNSKYLIDALRPFGHRVKIELVGNDEFWGIRITDYRTNRVAFIACMKEENND